MRIKALRTNKIVPGGNNLFALIKKFVPDIPERSILVITSKIVSICENNVLKMERHNKKKLIEKEADYFLPSQDARYNIVLTIKHNLLVPTAGIDESNGNGYFIFWPINPQLTANKVRKFLKEHYSLKNIGVIITDSRSTPLRMGTTGIGLSHSGFCALRNYINTPDIFGRKLKVTKANIMDSLATAAVLIMGEGNEQTPFAVIEDVPFVKFQDKDPSRADLEELNVRIDDDLYAPFLKSVEWIKGGD